MTKTHTVTKRYIIPFNVPKRKNVANGPLPRKLLLVHAGYDVWSEKSDVVFLSPRRNVKTKSIMA